MKLLETIDKEIARLEVIVENNRDTWESFEEERASLDYEGAGSSFGHSEDCFERGIEYGEWLEAKEMLKLLKFLKELANVSV